MRQLKSKIKEIKYKRLPHEVKTFEKVLENVEEVVSLYFPSSIFYKINNMVIFEKELLNHNLYINYDYFIKIFENGDGLLLEKKMENIETLINEKINISNYGVYFTTIAYRSFWNIL